MTQSTMILYTLTIFSWISSSLSIIDGTLQGRCKSLDHALHKIRRSAISPFFSKRQIVLIWPYILSKPEKLCISLQDIADTSTVFVLTRAFGCFSLDVINQVCFWKLLQCARQSRNFTPSISLNKSI